MPRRGAGLAAQAGAAHRRRAGAADPDRRCTGWASPRSASPAASRCCAAAWPASWSAPRRCAPRPEISLTTNGIGLDRLADPLHAAGLDRINVSLDTLRPETFRALARRDRLADVLAGLAAAAATGLAPVKVNAVLMRGLNDDEAVPLARFCLEHGYQLRFIEQMPLDAQHGWSRDEHGHRRRDPGRRCRRSSRSPPTTRPRAGRRPPRCSWSTAARPGSASSAR